MKPESLQALLVDCELGELSPEGAELLEAWLAEHPEAAGATPSIRRTCATAGAAMRRFPELVQPESRAVPLYPFRFRLAPLALAASLLVLLGGTAWLGFRAGRASVPEVVAANHRLVGNALPTHPVRADGPWARYQLVSDPRGGLNVIRRPGKPPS